MTKYKIKLIRKYVYEEEIEIENLLIAHDLADDLLACLPNNKFDLVHEYKEVEPKFDVECQDCHNHEGIDEELPYCFYDLHNHKEVWNKFEVAGNKRMENERNTCQRCYKLKLRCTYYLLTNRIIILCPECNDFRRQHGI